MQEFRLVLFLQNILKNIGLTDVRAVFLRGGDDRFVDFNVANDYCDGNEQISAEYNDPQLLNDQTAPKWTFIHF